MERSYVIISTWPGSYRSDELEELRELVKPDFDVSFDDLHEEGGPFGFDGTVMMNIVLGGAGAGAVIFLQETIKTLAQKFVGWVCTHMRKEPERLKADSPLEITMSPPRGYTSDCIHPAFKVWVYPAIPIRSEDRCDPAALGARLEDTLELLYRDGVRILQGIEGQLPSQVTKAELHLDESTNRYRFVTLIAGADIYKADLDASGPPRWRHDTSIRDWRGT